MPKEPHYPTSASAVFLPEVRAIAPDQPLQWLVLGWKDMARAPWLSIGHGAFMAVAGALLTWLAHDRFWLLVSAISGFLVIAPVLATSLYAMSRAMERGEAVNFQLLVSTWTQWQLKLKAQPDSYWSLIRFGMLLAIAATGWVLTSSALITLMAPVPIHTPMDFVRHVVLAKDNYLFELWLALGGLMAAPMFASSVVSMPMLLDSRVGVFQAVLTSWKTVLTHPAQMALWAFLIMGFSLLGVFSLFLGLVFVVPMLGHASWHAYRDLIDPSQLPERLCAEETLR
jgi:uncharacterized membrane protein